MRTCDDEVLSVNIAALDDMLGWYLAVVVLGGVLTLNNVVSSMTRPENEIREELSEDTGL